MFSELVHSETRDGFDINLYFIPEDTAPDWDFESESEKQELLYKIDRGIYLWFIAKVTASKFGVELGTDYIGGCCYESIDDFIQSGDYYDDMVNQAISRAKSNIRRLTT